MEPKALGEFEFIEQIQKAFLKPNDSIPLGIGDDAAAIIPTAQKYSLLTTDTLIEGIHFDRRTSSFEQVGIKSIMVNVSDIAAMGGLPLFFMVSLGIPSQVTLKNLKQLYRGISKGAKTCGINLIGGNTTRTQGSFFIAISLVGEVSKKQMVKRSGAQLGDALYVTGTLGDAAAGLDCLKNKLNLKSYAKMVKRHQNPLARWKEGETLSKARIPSAMIDLSDGLTADLYHIMKKSKVGAELIAAEIPISLTLKRYVKLRKVEAIEFALYGGEDYELLFSVPQEKEKKLKGLIKDGLVQASRIGAIIPKRKGLILKSADGIARKIVPRGYDHFE